MIDVNFQTNYADERTLAEFNRLLARRCEVLGESAKDAVVATAIDALKSIRAATATAEKRTQFKSIVEDTGWYGGFEGTAHRRVIRAGTKPNSPIVGTGGRRVKWLTDHEKKQANRHVYRVTPEHGKVRAYYVVASNAKDAAAFEKVAAAHRVDRFGGLAKNALGVAMAKLSTRNVGLDGNSTCRSRASGLAVVATGGAGADFAVTAKDCLNYAASALKGGRGMVDAALRKAANKISGQLAQAAKRKGLSEAFPTPFPEVKRRR